MRALRGFRFTTANVVITCSELKLNTAYQVEFENCAVRGNGRACEVRDRKITTTILIAIFGFQHPDRTGKLLTITMAITGKVFARISFMGSSCYAMSTSVEGSVVAENVVRGETVESGVNETEGPYVAENLPAKPITTVFVEESGETKTVGAGLRMFGEAATLDGLAEVTLSGRREWGIFAAENASLAGGCQSWGALPVAVGAFCWR
jgi:hypothetical protein